MLNSWIEMCFGTMHKC